MKNRSLIRNWRRIEKLWSPGFTKFSLLSLSLFFFVISPWPQLPPPSPPTSTSSPSSPSFSALFREPLMTFSFSGLFRALSSLLLLCLSSTETSSLSLPTSFSSSPHLSPLIPPLFLISSATWPLCSLTFCRCPFQLISALRIKRRIASHAKKIAHLILFGVVACRSSARIPASFK